MKYMVHLTPNWPHLTLAKKWNSSNSLKFSCLAQKTGKTAKFSSFEAKIGSGGQIDPKFFLMKRCTWTWKIIFSKKSHMFPPKSHMFPPKNWKNGHFLTFRGQNGTRGSIWTKNFFGQKMRLNPKNQFLEKNPHVPPKKSHVPPHKTEKMAIFWPLGA